MADNRMVVTLRLDDELAARLDTVSAAVEAVRGENTRLADACAALVDLVQDALHQGDELPWPFIKERMGARFVALMDRMERDPSDAPDAQDYDKDAG